MRKFNLTVLISLMLSGDMALMIAAIWQILALDGGYIKLGVLLASMAIVPAVLQSFFPSLEKIIQSSPHTILRTARIVGIVIALIAWSTNQVSTNAILLILASFSAVLFFTQQSLEVLMMQQVQSDKFSSHNASRILQVGMQLSTLIGMSIGGVLLHHYGMWAIYAYMLVSLSLGFILISQLPVTPRRNDESSEPAQSEINSKPKLGTATILLFLAMTCLMLHNGSFNFYIPTLFNQEKLWDADSYGYFSAAISAGAMLTWFSLGNGWIAKVMPFISTLVAIVCCYFIVQVSTQRRLDECLHSSS